MASPSSTYKPPQYLLARSLLTEEQVLTQFQEFQQGLKYITTAPELIFERLVGNLSEAIRAGTDEKLRSYAGAAHASETKNKVLQSSIKELQDQIQLLKSQGIALGRSTEAPESVSVPIAAARDGIVTTGAPNTADFRGTIIPTDPALPVPTTIIKFCFPKNNYNMCAQSPVAHALQGSRDLKGIYQTGCTWRDLPISTSHTKFQSGTYSVLKGDSTNPLARETSSPVEFEMNYLQPPTVVVWLTGFEMAKDGPCRLKTFAADVTEAGFTIRINATEDTSLHSVGVAWVAYQGDPINRTISGRFDIYGSAAWKNNKVSETISSYYSPKPYYPGKSYHMMFVSSIEVENTETMSLSLEYISTTGTDALQGRLTAVPAELCLYSVGVSYMVHSYV